jgi:phage terminase large subunit
LGKPKTKKFVVCPSDNEIESIAILKENLNKIIYPENLEKEIIRKEKLFELPEEIERGEMYSENSRMKILIKYFKDLGYSYATSLYSNGSYCLVKRTKNNNQIKLFFDADVLPDNVM